MLASTVSRLHSAALRRCSRFGTNSFRGFSRSCAARSDDDDLPYHIVVGMPALSPTMETGILSEWYVEEGAGFSAGESLAKIETDKASIDFEAQDDGYIAKILMEAGSGDDIEVGVPIMVTVEEEEDVAAFADFVLEEAPAEAAPEPASAPEVAPAPEPVAVAAPPPAAPAPVVVEEPPPAAEPAAAAAPGPTEEMAAAVAPVLSTGWGSFAAVNSPIAKTLAKQQSEYVALYGTTGQVPL